MHALVVLDNIRSAYNVGSIFRTSDAAGVAKLYLCGTTPVPTDRFGRKRNDIAKTALGAEESIAWEYAASTLECIEKLRSEGVEIVAVEQDDRAIPYNKIPYFQLTGSKDAAFVFGDEVGGVAKEVLDAADHIIEIPMRGKKESLNVGVSAGVILFR